MRSEDKARFRITTAEFEIKRRFLSLDETRDQTGQTFV